VSRARRIDLCGGAFLAILAACTSHQTARIDLDGVAFDYGFIVVYDGAKKPTRLTPPFEFNHGTVPLGDLPSLVLRPNETSFALVGIDADSLSKSAPGFVPARAEEITATLGTPPPSIALEPGDSAHPIAGTKVPDDAMVWTRPIDGADRPLVPSDETKTPVRGVVTLHIPYDPEFCRIPNETDLAPFGAMPVPFRNTSSSTGAVAIIHDVAWLDPDRIVGMTDAVVFALKRGGTIEDDAILWIGRAKGSTVAVEYLSHFALDPRPDDNGRRRIVVVATLPNSDISLSYIHDVAIGADDRPMNLATSTIADLSLRDAAIDSSGRVVAAGVGGGIWVRDPNEASFHRMGQLDLAFPGRDGVDRLHATGSGATPFVATTLSRIHTYDPVTTEWNYEQGMEGSIGIIDSARFFAIANGPATEPLLDVWVGGIDGLVFRDADPTHWIRPSIHLPPRLAPCGTGSPEPSIFTSYNALAINGDYVHGAVASCTAIIQIRRSDLCGSVLTPKGVMPAEAKQSFSALDAIDRHLVVGGEGGIVMESSW
jgi:hypothetical protein